MCQDEGVQSLREAEREAGLESIATEIVAEVPAWSKAHPEAKWEELEEAVLKGRQRFGERVLERLVAEREATRPVVGPRCSQCGAELQYQGQKTRYVVSSLGETTITRRYYHCANCKEGGFSPGREFGVNGAPSVEPPVATTDEQVGGALALCGRGDHAGFAPGGHSEL